MPHSKFSHCKQDKSEKREKEKHGACKSCMFTYRRKLSPKEISKNKSNGTSKKRELVALKGGKCEKCGYDKCLAALTFHHKDRCCKAFTISGNLGLPLDVLKEEASKCLLLCLNCHAEEHHGLNGFGNHPQNDENNV